MQELPRLADHPLLDGLLSRVLQHGETRDVCSNFALASLTLRKFFDDSIISWIIAKEGVFSRRSWCLNRFFADQSGKSAEGAPSWHETSEAVLEFEGTQTTPSTPAIASNITVYVKWTLCCNLICLRTALNYLVGFLLLENYLGGGVRVPESRSLFYDTIDWRLYLRIHIWLLFISRCLLSPLAILFSSHLVS